MKFLRKGIFFAFLNKKEKIEKNNIIIISDAINNESWWHYDNAEHIHIK